MESLVEQFRDLGAYQKLVYVAGGVAVAVVTVVAIKKIRHKKERKVYPRDVVILRQIGRGPYAPSMTPFAVKLETYLRMARIPYQNVHGYELSPKGKVPWIEYNGEAVADSTLCINFLNQKLGIDLNKHLRPAERGIALSMQVLVEDHLYWSFGLFRWAYDNDKSMILNTFHVGKFFMWTMKRGMMKTARAQGIGRHTEEEVTQMMKKDFQALSDFLGEKKFLMGDEPCETDCAVFGLLSQIYWQFLGSGHDNILKDEYSNLAEYCERMKTHFWPDWDQCITNGGTQVATK